MSTDYWNRVRALNSATKYPSIPTYHKLANGPLGLLEEVEVPFQGDVVLTEKVDGTNVRIIFPPLKGLGIGARPEYLIGSRQDLVHSHRDLLWSDEPLEIVEHTIPVAQQIIESFEDDWIPESGITVFYLEMYGQKRLPASRHYSALGGVGFRLFDIAFIDPVVLERGLEQVASWRDHGGQHFCTETRLQEIANGLGLELTPRLLSTPGRLFTVPAADLPVTLANTQEWLKLLLPQTQAGIDITGGRAEGVVLRTKDRSAIAKARFQDYAKATGARVRQSSGKT